MWPKKGNGYAFFSQRIETLVFVYTGYRVSAGALCIR